MKLEPGLYFLVPMTVGFGAMVLADGNSKVTTVAVFVALGIMVWIDVIGHLATRKKGRKPRG